MGVPAAPWRRGRRWPAWSGRLRRGGAGRRGLGAAVSGDMAARLASPGLRWAGLTCSQHLGVGVGELRHQDGVRVVVGCGGAVSLVPRAALSEGVAADAAVRRPCAASASTPICRRSRGAAQLRRQWWLAFGSSGPSALGGREVPLGEILDDGDARGRRFPIGGVVFPPPLAPFLQG
jgi:hypothetical protein